MGEYLENSINGFRTYVLNTVLTLEECKIYEGDFVMKKFGYLYCTMALCIMMFMTITGCGNKSSGSGEDTVVWEVPDTVYRPWNEVKDDDYYKIAEDKRFNVEYPDGSILIFGVNEDGETVNVFGGNPNGVEKLVIPGEVEFSGRKYRVYRIARHAFATFFNDSIKWMEGVKEISVGEGIENCGLGCFEGAPDVVHISLPASLSSIGYSAMSDCEKLEKVEIAENSKLLMIENFAFMNCTALKEFEIPASVRQIRECPWRNCKSLQFLSIKVGNLEYKVEDGVLYTISGRQLVQYPAGKNDKEYQVALGTMEIDNSAFYGNEYLEKVTLPNSLETIQHLGFAECTALKDVEFNVGLKWIGNSAFQGCTSLKKVSLPGNTEYTQGNSYGYDTFPDWTTVRN